MLSLLHWINYKIDRIGTGTDSCFKHRVEIGMGIEMHLFGCCACTRATQKRAIIFKQSSEGWQTWAESVAFVGIIDAGCKAQVGGAEENGKSGRDGGLHCHCTKGTVPATDANPCASRCIGALHLIGSLRTIHTLITFTKPCMTLVLASAFKQRCTAFYQDAD